MQQVLFHIPGFDLPVYGFGVMLFIVFVVTMWLAGRRGEREGMPRDRVQDLVLWTFIGGLIGARIFYLVQYRDTIENPFLEFFQIWNGGIVFYGSALGGWLAAMIAHHIFLKRFNISTWKLADALAPSIAIGLCLGRIGCFLNGCCWGHAACPDSPAVHFPLMTTPARFSDPKRPNEKGLWLYQTSAGFAMDPRARDERTVGAVEPDSTAATVAGLEPGDLIVGVDGKPVENYSEMLNAIAVDRRRGEKDVTLKVRRGAAEITLPTYTPRTIGLIPTQLYESVTMFLIFLVLLALYPLRRYDGQLIVVLMLCYAVHRYFNEALRNDTPTYSIDLFGAHIQLGLTISQWISIGIFSAGLALHFWRRRYPLQPAIARTAVQESNSPARLTPAQL